MVRAEPIWNRLLASDYLLSRHEIFSAANASRGVHGNAIGARGMASWPEAMSITVSVDASELEQDLERIETGDLELPTVSAVRLICDGVFEEDVPLWLPEA